MTPLPSRTTSRTTQLLTFQTSDPRYAGPRTLFDPRRYFCAWEGIIPHPPTTSSPRHKLDHKNLPVFTPAQPSDHPPHYQILTKYNQTPSSPFSTPPRRSSVTATTPKTTCNCPTPADFAHTRSARQASRSVAPVVVTSSTSTTVAPARRRRSTPGLHIRTHHAEALDTDIVPRTLTCRSDAGKLVWLGRCLRPSTEITGTRTPVPTPSPLPTPPAITRGWSIPRDKRRRKLVGTGTTSTRCISTPASTSRRAKRRPSSTPNSWPNCPNRVYFTSCTHPAHTPTYAPRRTV